MALEVARTAVAHTSASGKVLVLDEMDEHSGLRTQSCRGMRKSARVFTHAPASGTTSVMAEMEKQSASSNLCRKNSKKPRELLHMHLLQGKCL
eukprot:1144262-Pelagomonas_calceolata.AAC.1